jgi:ribosomal RNA-processing protein 12
MIFCSVNLSDNITNVSILCFSLWKVIAKVLGTAIGEYKDLRLDAMSALRKLIMSSQEAANEDNVKEMARFAKNYLPVLFNLYTTKPSGTDEEGQRLAAYETVKVLLFSSF